MGAVKLKALKYFNSIYPFMEVGVIIMESLS